MNTQEMEAKIKSLEDRLSRAEAVQEIERLQRIYGYYLDAGMHDDICDLFAEATESIEIGNIGVYMGKKGVIRLFTGFYDSMPKRPMRMLNHFQLQGVISVDPNGSTAKGRWHCIMMHTGWINNEPVPILGKATYECEYIKEDGKWKFKKLHLNPTFRTTLTEGWIKAPAAGTSQFQVIPDEYKPDKPPTAFHPYPEDFVYPLHFKNPITGK